MVAIKTKHVDLFLPQRSCLTILWENFFISPISKIKLLELIFFSLGLDWFFFSYCIYEGRDEWQEKFGYILSYLEQPKDYSDSPSTTTETSDSGMPRPHGGAASELGSDEISGKIRQI